MCTGRDSFAAAKSGAVARTAAMNPFISQVPRPYNSPSASRMRNGSEDQSWSATGTTSLWPDSTMPPSSFGPMVANRLALLPISSTITRVSAPRSPSRSAAQAMSSRLPSLETVAKEINSSSRVLVSSISAMPVRPASILDEERARAVAQALRRPVFLDQDALGDLEARSPGRSEQVRSPQSGG